MSTALERLKQGSLGSPLDRLRQGVQVDFSETAFKTSTLPIAPQEPEKLSLFSRIKAGVLETSAKFQEAIGGTGKTLVERVGGVREKVRSVIAPTKQQILAEIEKQEGRALTPEEGKERVIKILEEEAIFLPTLFAATEKGKKQTPEEFFAEPLPVRVGFDVAAIERVGSKISGAILKRLAKEIDPIIIKKTVQEAGETIGEEAAKRIGEAKTPTAVKQILDAEAQKVASLAKEIPKEIEPLAQEARKFKTAEEFVKAQNPVFRGGEKIDLAKGSKEGISVSTSKEVAKDFGKGKVVEELFIDPKARIATEKDALAVAVKVFPKAESQLALESLKLNLGVEGPARRAILDEFRKLGFDAVDYGKISPVFAEAEIRVLNPSILKTKSQLTDFYEQAVREVKEVKPKKPLGLETAKNLADDAVPLPTSAPIEQGEQSAIQKLIKIVKEAVPVRKEQEALFSAERAKRVAQAARAGEAISGEAGFFAQLSKLKGELPRVQFEAVRRLFSQSEVDSLFNVIEKTNILTFEKITAKGALQGIFEGAVPTKNEIALLKEIFPEELINELLKKRPLKDRLFDLFGQIWNIPKSIMASVDLSAPLRQGIFLIGRPKQFVPAFLNMFKFAFSEKAYIGLQKDIQSRSTYKLMREAGLALTDLGESLLGREEAIMSQLPERIPLVGKVIRMSNRAFAGFINKLRADTFDDIVRNSKRLGKELDDRELKGIGAFINAATGRGNMPKALEKAAPILNGAFFSPRLIASRINLLNPYFYVTLPPVARKEAVKSLFTFAAIAGTVIGLARLGGAETSGDPRSADFGKIKSGNTRYDVLGGFQQYIRLVSQLISGEIISSTTGRTITLGEGFKPLTRKDILLRFFENKESPIVSFLTAWLTGTTFTGEDFDMPSEIVNRFIPMVIQDMYELGQEKGAEGLLMGLPAIFGTGVQTYGKQELVFGESAIGEETAQIRPTRELADKLRELVLGQLPLGSSKSFSVEAYFEQLSNLPREESAEIFEKIAEVNPDLAKKLADVVKEKELGITVKDKDLKSKGVASGDRTLAVKKELDKLKTKESKAALWEDYARKGIITKEVGRQLKILLK